MSKPITEEQLTIMENAANRDVRESVVYVPWAREVIGIIAEVRRLKAERDDAIRMHGSRAASMERAEELQEQISIQWKTETLALRARVKELEDVCAYYMKALTGKDDFIVAEVLAREHTELERDALRARVKELEAGTIDALATQQGVTPCDDPSALIGGWPGDVDDGFEEAVDEARHGSEKRKHAEQDSEAAELFQRAMEKIGDNAEFLRRHGWERGNWKTNPAAACWSRNKNGPWIFEEAAIHETLKGGEHAVD